MANDVAPSFTCLDADGNTFSLATHAGKNIVLYFYPKDDTPGCTQQACDFRDKLAEFSALDVEIIGVSKDPAKNHLKFREKYDLPFTLLTDPDGVLCQQFNVWVEKKMFNRRYMGIERSTFFIDKNGTIKQLWRKVKDHVDKVLQYAQENC